MNHIFKTILVSGASALTGGIVGYIFCKKTMESKLQKQFEEAVNEEIDKIRKGRESESIVGETKPKYGDSFEIVTHMGFGDEIQKRLNRENDYWRVLGEQKVAYWRDHDITDITILQKLEEFYASVQTLPEDDPDEYDDDEPQEVMESWAEQGPCVISVEEYDDLPPYFDRVTWHYFEQDDTLIDEGDQLVDDIERWIGDALVHFGEDPQDNDVVYVANGRMGSAIEVVRMHKAYSEWGM